LRGLSFIFQTAMVGLPSELKTIGRLEPQGNHKRQ
jgi:hypothetical protein